MGKLLKTIKKIIALVGISINAVWGRGSTAFVKSGLSNSLELSEEVNNRV